jgi:SAM-dependent methyltransferase
MPISLSEIASLLCCPDDEEPMEASGKGLRCARCQRFYPLLSPNILQLLPSRPINFPERCELALYREGCHREFSKISQIRSDAQAWGAPEARSRKWLGMRERQAREVFAFLGDKRDERELIFCDLSAGPGHCTFRAVGQYRLVFHCDLSLDALAYADAKAIAAGLENIVFVRADYFQPPFRNTIDHLVCLDTLIRGPWHEERLLRSIQGVLDSEGTAVVDFHNWWHNPLRRLGLLPDNFVGNKSYTRKELVRLMETSGIGRFETRPFVQEVDPSTLPGTIFARLIPPTRLMVRLAWTNATVWQCASAGSGNGRNPSRLGSEGT